jgi:adenylate cyclase
LSDIPVADRFLWPIEPIRRVSESGFVNVSLDQAGTPRYVPLVMRADEGLVPSFALAVAGAATGAPVLEARTLLLGGRSIDTDLGQNMPLRFYGPGESFRTISAADVLRGHVPDEAIRDHIVIIGATAAGVGDTFSTPFDPILPGVELLATAVGNLLEGHGLVRTVETRRIDAAAAILLPLLAILLMSLQRVGIGLALTALVVAVWAAVTTIAFSRGYWLSAAVPIAALSVPGALYAFGRMVLLRATERSLAVTQQTMRLFHPPVLADRLATSPDYLSQPVQQDVAVLFVDLNGFTAMSERIGPSETRDRLKSLHTIIDETVERHGGVTLNYMGDGAMIVFGLPETRAGDADRAMDASIDLIGSIQSWLDSLAPEERHARGVRIGAHYGPVVVSRLGGEHHQQITISGDTVNVASRLLDIASASGARIALSADLAAALSRRPPGVLSDGRPVAIRGRALPLTVLAWTPEPDPVLPARRAGP